MVLAAVGMGLAAPSLTLLSLTHAPVGGQGYASSAMQASQNLGQTVVLALASALFSAMSAATGQLTPFVWTFALLLLPVSATSCLAGRARMTDRSPGGRVVLATTDFEGTTAFFRDGLGSRRPTTSRTTGRFCAGPPTTATSSPLDLQGPAGNVSEYYSDMDCVVDDRLWKLEVLAEGLFNRGPPPPPPFRAPEDLAALTTGSHGRAG
ncbi:hypothetical protein GCM10010345_87640 [Streptomyces canarius]|uniref:Major facilitator superfamily (MFS) profile domain-containing protein n=1 Tax=Streptomyces canarius TaxID=285453 RepID=A0ABQ3DGC6_9ACTN|nr:hypothetical protein GCM10010345_87640 [Streptomyces canarius]